MSNEATTKLPCPTQGCPGLNFPRDQHCNTCGCNLTSNTQSTERLSVLESHGDALASAAFLLIAIVLAGFVASVTY